MRASSSQQSPGHGADDDADWPQDMDEPFPDVPDVPDDAPGKSASVLPSLSVSWLLVSVLPAAFVLLRLPCVRGLRCLCPGIRSQSLSCVALCPAFMLTAIETAALAQGNDPLFSSYLFSAF